MARVNQLLWDQFYQMDFLPLIEILAQLRISRGEHPYINQQDFGLYFGIDRRDIKYLVDRAVSDGLIVLTEKKCLFDDEKKAHPVQLFELVPCEDDHKYKFKLQEFINSYLLWEICLSDRAMLAGDYKAKLDHKKLQNAVLKLQTGEKLSTFEKKLMHRHELNHKWLEKCPIAVDLINEVNERRPEDLKSSFLAEGKNREANWLCGTLNPENAHDNASKEELAERMNRLHKYFNSNNIVEFDTNASIYRLTYFLSHEQLLDHSSDVYHLIWNDAYPNTEFSSEIRQCLKVLCMPIIMSDGNKVGYNAMLSTKTGSLTKSEALRKEKLLYLKQVTGNTPLVIMRRLYEAMKVVLGCEHFMQEEIFFPESILHLLIILAFRERGIDTINVYDGFYFKEGTCTQELFDHVYDECSMKLLSILKEKEP